MLPTLLCWNTLRKDSPFISNVQRNGQIFSSSDPILTFAAILLLCAFTNAEWLTPDEREPPAFSSPAVESIGGLLREGDCYM